MTEAAAAPQTERKKIIFSAIQPTGVFTLGNRSEERRVGKEC